ncbi:hypothetical protein [Dactylosporangium sp. NPDC051541]|uniref:hypothetical protein n=1 Tax=Dactylosporangium sp. NPDC051541 TaxID=3363977 RepID=UPI0037B449D3
MAATMVVGALVACVYVALIAMHVAAIRHGGTATGHRPGLARWLAASGERRRGNAERDAARRRLTGELGRADYHAVMAALAARDAVEHPLQVPKSRL